MKKIIQLICCLILWAMAASLQAQTPEFESIPLGWRVKIDRPVTVYGDYLGRPNPYDRYTMNSRYFFQLVGTQVEGVERLKGKFFTKILIPGTPPDEDSTSSRMRTFVVENGYQSGRGGVGITGSESMDWESEDTTELRISIGETKRLIIHLAIDEKADVEPAPSPTEEDSFPIQNDRERQIQESEKGRCFWIETDYLAAEGFDDHDLDLEDNHVNTKRFDRAKLYSRTFVSILAVPFKYRFSYKKGGATVLTGESSVGPSIGYRLVKSNFFDRNLWLMGSAGITLINPNLLLADSTVAKQKMEPGVTACIGIGGNIGTTQFGIVHGWDFTDDSWAFHRKPWLAFSIGVAITKRNAKSVDQ